MLAEIQQTAQKGLHELAYLASIETRAGWEKLESAWLGLEKALVDVEVASAKTAQAATDLVIDEIAAGIGLIRRVF